MSGQRIEVREVEVASTETPIMKALKAVNAPMTRSQFEKMAAWIECESRSFGEATKRHLVHQVNEATHELARITEALGLARQRVQDAEAASAAAPTGSLYAAVVFCAGAVVLMAIEVALTLQSLPQLLGFRSDAFWAYVISLSPALMIIALEVVLARLIEKPWRAVRDQIRAGRFKRYVVGIVMAGQLLVVLVLTGLSVYYIAITREDAGHKREMLASTETPPAEPQNAPLAADTGAEHNRLRRAIVILSLAVALDGALVLVIGTHEAGLLRERRRRYKTRDLARREWTVQTALHSEAQTKLADSRRQLETAEQQAATEEEKYRKWLEYELQAAQSRAMQHLSEADKMKTRLALSLT